MFKIVPAGAGRELRDHPVGTGPYEFVSYAVDDRLELRAFRDYFDGLPRNRGIVHEDRARRHHARARAAEGARPISSSTIIPPDMVYQLEKEGLALTKSPGVDYQYLGFNLRDPILKDVRVRHAIGYAIDRQAIVDYLRRGLATVGRQHAAAHQLGVRAGRLRLRLRPRARQGAARRSRLSAIPTATARAPRLSLSLKTTNIEFNRLQAAVIQQNLRDVGIELDVRSYEFATLYADILKGNFQMYTLQWVGGALADPDILRRVFHSQQVPPAGFNRGHFSDPEVDRLIDEASNATDYENAARALRKSPAAHRRSRALHQPVAPRPTSRSSQPDTPGHPPHAAGRFHVSPKRLAVEFVTHEKALSLPAGADRALHRRSGG